MIGKFVNDLMDKLPGKSEKPVPEYLMDRIANVFRTFFYVAAACSVSALLLALWEVGFLQTIVYFLFPFQYGFWDTVIPCLISPGIGH